MSQTQSLSKLSVRGRLLLLLGAAAIVAWLAVACGGDSEADEEAAALPTATVPPDTPPEEEYDYVGSPPALTVVAGETTVLAGFGSFCGKYACVDAVGYITLTEPLLMPAGELTATLASGTIAEMSVTATPTSILQSQPVCGSDATPFGPACDREDDQLTWTGAFGQGSALSANADRAAIEVDISSLDAGTYVVHFTMIFASGDDAGYDVLIEVG